MTTALAMWATRPPCTRVPRWLAECAVTVALVAGCARLGYLHLFSHFSIDDDEGWIAQSIWHVLNGATLYDEATTSYGPLFYSLAYLLFGWLDVALGADSLRWSTLVCWLLAALIVGCGVVRMSGSKVLAWLAGTATFYYLGPLGVGAGHPQGLVVVLLAAMMMAPALSPRRWPLYSALAVGGLLLTKINVGYFALVGTMLSLAFALQRNAASVSLRQLAVVLFLTPAALIVSATRSALVAEHYLNVFVVLLAQLALLIVIWERARTDPVEREGILGREVLGALACLIALYMSCTLMLHFLHGTGFIQAAFGYVLTPSRLQVAWGFGWGFTRTMLLVATFGLVLSYLNVQSQNRILAMLWVGLAIGLPIVLLWRITGSFYAIFLSAYYFAPYAWLLLRPAHQSIVRRHWVAVALPQLLQGIPIAGAQIAIGSFLMLPIALLVMHDGLAQAQSALSGVRHARFFKRIARFLPTLLLLLLLYVLGSTSQALEQTYRSQVSLDLPGARLLRVPVEQRDFYHAVIRSLAPNSTFAATASINSLYLWSGKHQPFPIPNSHALCLYSEAEQLRVLERLLATPRPAVIVAPPAFDFFPVNPPDCRFIQELQRQFRPDRNVGPWQIWERREAPQSGSR